MTEEKYVMCKPTMKNAIEMQCHECMGRYSDGKIDCENVTCSLYEFMPYRRLHPNVDWRKYHARRSGRVLREPPSQSQIENGKRLAAMVKKGSAENA